MVYACKEKTNTWFKIVTKSITNNDQSMKSSKLSKYPSLIISPRLHDNLSEVPLIRQNSKK